MCRLVCLELQFSSLGYPRTYAGRSEVLLTSEFLIAERRGNTDTEPVKEEISVEIMSIQKKKGSITSV